MATTGRRRRGDDDSVNFSGVKAGGGGRSAHLPENEGPYVFKITDGEKKESEKGSTYIGWTLTVVSGKYKGKKIRNHVTSLNPKALWNLRGMMEAAGVNPGDRTVKVADIIKRLMNKTFSANVEDDEYEDRVKSVISEYLVKGKSKTKDEDDDDDEEEEDEEEEEEEDEDEEDEDEDEEEDEEEPPAKKSRGKASTSRASKASSTKASSSRQSSKSSRSAKKRSSDDDEDEDDEDLDDIDLDDL